MMDKIKPLKSPPKPAKGKSGIHKPNKPKNPGDINAKHFVDALMSYQSPLELKKHHRFFEFNENNPGDGLQFAGVRMGQIFALADAYIDMQPSEIEKLLDHPIYEVKAGACSIMGKQAAFPKTTEARRKELYILYLQRHERINHWGLVDLAAHKVIGRYLYEYGKPRDILRKLARSKEPMERRSAMVSTLYFIGKGEVVDALAIAGILMKEKHDLVQKAIGWALRETGKKDKKRLLTFLDKYIATIPRVTLRYAIEHFDKKLKDHYMKP